MTMTTGASTGVGFFSPKNEKVQRVLGWIAGLAVLGTIAYYVLPFVLTLTSIVLQIAAMGVFLWILSLFVFNPKLRWAIGYLAQRSVGALTIGIIKKDPIGVMKSYLKEMDENINILSTSIGEVRGAVSKSRSDLTNDTAERTTQEGIVIAAQAQGQENSPAAHTAANKVLRRDQSITRLQAEIEQGEAMVKLLQGYLDQSQAYRDDRQDVITTTERERKRVKTSFRAFGAAKKILQGGSVGAEMANDALEVAREQTAMMVGEMQQYAAVSQGALQSFELQQDGAVRQVLARLQHQSEQSKLLEFKPGVPMDMVTVDEPASASIDRFLKQ